jgi:hypothetical protein
MNDGLTHFSNRYSEYNFTKPRGMLPIIEEEKF